MWHTMLHADWMWSKCSFSQQYTKICYGASHDFKLSPIFCLVFLCCFFLTFSSESQMNQWVIKCNEHNRTSVSYLVSFTILANPGDRKCTIIWQWSTLLTLSEMCSVTVHTNFQLQKMSKCSGTDKMEEAFRTICWSQKEGN